MLKLIIVCAIGAVTVALPAPNAEDIVKMQELRSNAADGQSRPHFEEILKMRELIERNRRASVSDVKNSQEEKGDESDLEGKEDLEKSEFGWGWRWGGYGWNYPVVYRCKYIILLNFD